MGEPIITWYVKEDDKYKVKEEHHAGTYNKEAPLLMSMQVWNNRFGVENVEDLKNAVLVFYFDTLEDSALLEHCRVSIEGLGEMPLTIVDKRGSVHIGKTLSGKANDGDHRKLDNEQHFVDIDFMFEAENETLKDNDLKRVHFEIITL